MLEMGSGWKLDNGMWLGKAEGWTARTAAIFEEYLSEEEEYHGGWTEGYRAGEEAAKLDAGK